ncbi:maltose/maltodextrin ABC transporter, permease protein malF [Halarchaeum acidiphilum MH1-52-1]|uniref:Maltose/maltodextrin ABC transporter, permease protein malF n=1 Tax=Halarchaeum acidiphilum MH1-52-1 TaxID=1261545 RepID=U2YFM3_9EURY|nr:sugar ABC transporter permease [Halarchaeum acidiphilum]GAD52856.1 maltose/maltodextrin ABC transporter, permease protein malF [Halarchaeum acidiphilum MH1-52-1]
MSYESETRFTEPETTYEEVRQRVSRVLNDHILLVLLGPALLVIAAIFVYPVFQLVKQSFYLTIPGVPNRFIGLRNYTQMLGRTEFWTYFGHTLVYSFGSLILSLGSGLAVALAINHVVNQRIRNIYSTLLMFAWAIPIAVVAMIWKWVLTGNKLGLINMILMDLGILQHPYAWLANQNLAMALVTFTDAWARMPFAMIVLLAGLQSIPGHMYDAAKVDGATTFQTFRAITVPYLRPYLAIVALMNWMFAFRAFAIIFPLTSGGPGTRTTVFSIYIYRTGMINFNYGYASAIAVFIILISLVVAIVYVTKVMGGVQEE